MFRCLGIAIFVTLICSDQVLCQPSSDKEEAVVQLKKLSLLLSLNPVYARDTLMGRSVITRYTPASLKDVAVKFLREQFSKFNSPPFKMGIINTNPVTLLVENVRGYVTKAPKLWEKVVIRIENFEWGKNVLAFQISMYGEYLKLATPTVSDGAFDNSYWLEKDYAPQLKERCIDMAISFKNYLRSHS